MPSDLMLPRARAHTHTQSRTHTQPRARARTHTHTVTHTGVGALLFGRGDLCPQQSREVGEQLPLLLQGEAQQAVQELPDVPNLLG